MSWTDQNKSVNVYGLRLQFLDVVVSKDTTYREATINHAKTNSSTETSLQYLQHAYTLNEWNVPCVEYI